MDSNMTTGLHVGEDRHPGIKHFVPLFAFGHLPEGPLRDTSRMVCTLAQEMVESLEDGAELTAGLRKLLEAKDCFVRQAVIGRGARTS
jgi:hypothetical protein